MAKPIPCAAPVTTALRPFRSIWFMIPRWCYRMGVRMLSASVISDKRLPIKVALVNKFYAKRAKRGRAKRGAVERGHRTLLKVCTSIAIPTTEVVRANDSRAGKSQAFPFSLGGWGFELPTE